MDIKLMPEKYTQQEEGSPEYKPASRANFWLTLIVAFFVLVVLTYGGLWIYKNSLVKEKESLARELGELTAQRDLELEDKFMELTKGIDNFKRFLENRLYTSHLFEMLEELTLPQVQLADFSADLSQNALNLEIRASNYQTLAKQLVAFEEDWRIEKIEFSGVNLNEAGQVSSELKVNLNPDFLLSESE